VARLHGNTVLDSQRPLNMAWA